MPLTAEGLLKLPKSQQKVELTKFSAAELRVITHDLQTLATAKKYTFVLLGKNQIEKLVPDSLRTHWIPQLLKRFPEVQNGLALDRHWGSGQQKEKLEAIIDDINNKRLPKHRFHELLHQNFFEGVDEGRTVPVARTFFAYAFPKLKDPNGFLGTLKELLGQRMFDFYMNTLNYLPYGQDYKILTVSDLYTKEHGIYAVAPKPSSEHINILRRYAPLEPYRRVINITEVDTHNTSSHKSADESHVTAFRMMAEKEKLNVRADYEKPIKETDPSRKVTITSRGQLNAFVTKQLSELQAQVNALCTMTDAKIYNEYLRYDDIEKFRTIEHSNLEEKDKVEFGQRIAGFRFQANAAKRYIGNMQTDHKCDSGDYKYDTNIANTCGLTMEEMLATAFWASKDKDSFKENATVKGNFISLVRQLHDMRRGYNIDDRIDNPETNEYPNPPGTDNNRCAGGGVNSLAWALNSGHAVYNNVMIDRLGIENELRKVYEEIISKDSTIDAADSEELSIWAESGKITGALRAQFTEKFEEKYQKEFVDYFKGYIADGLFATVLEQGLDSIKMPAKHKGKTRGIESWNQAWVWKGIMGEDVPLLCLDTEYGYQSGVKYVKDITVFIDSY